MSPGLPICSIAPSFITTIRSEIDSASSWSWVTKIVVMPSFRCSARMSSRSPPGFARRAPRAARRAAESAGSGRARGRATRAAAGRPKAGGENAGEVRQLDQRQHLVDPRIDLGRRLARDLEAEGDVAFDCHVGKERIGLKHHADRAAASRPGGHVAAAMRIDPSVGVSKPAIIRRVVVLPQPLGPEKAHELAALDREVEVLHDRLGAEALADAGQREEHP